MDKLEQYLDQVCRSIGGPRSLRRHVRQELREHLLDAAAKHRTGGLSEDEALARALAEFGKPEEMRTELEATHGHRVMAVVIDKALDWKEKTMRAKWLWTTWATAAIVVVIALAVLLITGIELFIVPKFNQLMRDGLIDPAIIDEQGVSWMLSWLNDFHQVAEHATWWVLLAAGAWGLFEWRVRSENKTLMRLSALGTVAVALMAVVWLTAATLLISFCLAVPAKGRLARIFALEQIAKIDVSVDALGEAVAKKDWQTAGDHVNRASQEMQRLAEESAVIPALITRNEPATVEKRRADVKGARETLSEAQQAVVNQDSGRIQTAIERFRKSYDPVRKGAKRLER
ncbi:MAG: permease prefix domain 1-containing protein [Pirellulales bacterium]